MRHRVATKILDRPSSQRMMLRRSLSISLVEHERITTTLAKAKWLRPFAEHLVTIAKAGNLAARRQLLATLNNVPAAHKLVDVLGVRFKERNGGYLRIIKVGPRLGDGAAMAMIEFVERSEAKKSAQSKNKKAHGIAKKNKTSAAVAKEKEVAHA